MGAGQGLVGHPWVRGRVSPSRGDHPWVRVLWRQEWPWGSSERLPLPVHTSAGLELPRQHWDDWRGQLR